MFWLALICVLFIFQILTILLSEFRSPSKAVAWLSILFIFPVIGFLMYYFLAKGYTQRRKVRRKNGKIMKEIRRDLLRQTTRIKQSEGSAAPSILDNHRLFGLLRNLPGSPVTKYNETKVLTNAEATYKAMLEAMEQAEDHIHLEVYTIRDDAIGRKFQNLMIRKAGEGVKVRLLYDGVGSYELPDSYVRKLREAGVETGCFLPPFIALFDKRLNYRNHRKTMVVDGAIGFLGGLNIGDEYLGGNKKLGFWRDTHLMLRGDSVFYLQNTFLTDWSFVTGKNLSDPRFYPEHDCDSQELVQIVTSGPDEHWDSILEVYFASISTAKNRVYIATPYFIPDPSIMMALKTAAISGVDVRIILPGVPDTRIVHLASLSYLEELMQAGVRFYQYQRGFIHAKVLIADHTLATVGTANLDMRSFYSNFELNAVMFNKSVINRLERDFVQDLKDSKELTLANFEKRSRLQRGKEVVARLLSPLF
ncbi:cardiolipin synthase [Paenibacillus contaminans]|uniref:Cardiolipin synthase n=1 Tax=Paenibacillus contaminans TaxID=450362 RepID=A0A329MJX6_9BACL|nr:cardiolipin synthase [Paenibacillus contaminans]RAV20251.1 cardiolipin synthase [Paenibacillus contaminans]